MPVLDLTESIYYSDFNILGSERQGSMGISLIPITRITQYAIQEEIHNIDLFKRIIVKVDQEYCKMVTDDQVKKSNRKTPPKTKR